MTDESMNLVFTRPELEWFRKNAYNTGVSNLGTWDTPCLISIFTSCLSFIKAYPYGSAVNERTELDLMSARCHFILATLLTSKSRETKNSEFYTTSRNHVAAYQAIFQRVSTTVDEPTHADLSVKLATLAVFDFEAATHLEQFDDLQNIIQGTRIARDVAAFKAMGDCISQSQAPANGTVPIQLPVFLTHALNGSRSHLPYNEEYNQRNIRNGTLQQRQASQVHSLRLPDSPPPRRRPRFPDARSRATSRVGNETSRPMSSARPLQTYIMANVCNTRSAKVTRV